MQLEIQSVGSAFEGRRFGAIGAYEKVIGRAHGQIDPRHKLNTIVTNLDKVPPNAHGLVDYSFDFCILKPADMAKANRRVFYDALNRGDKLALVDINSAQKGPTSNDLDAAADAGNGFLMRQGYVVAFSAWQGRVAAGEGHMLADFPTATQNGQSIVATTREEIMFAHCESPARWPLPYSSHVPNQAAARLTVRQQEYDERTLVSANKWRFVSDDAIEIDLVEGFDAGALYELIYDACDPTVMGIGFIAVRDFIDVLRTQAEINDGVSNPLNIDGAPAIDHCLAHGRSQPGRFLREFLHLGFNESLRGERIFDGVYATLTGSRRMFINEPFSQPGRFPRQHEDHLFPGDQFPFTYATRTDSFTQKTDGILRRCWASNTCPKIMHVDSSTEFWQGRSSLIVCDEKGEVIEVPDEVRTYLLSGTGHAGPQMLAHAEAYWAPSQNPVNAHDYCALVRALIVALDAWVTEDVAPPPNRFPSLHDNSLVPALPPEGMGFPAIPGAVYSGISNPLSDRDYSVQPPTDIADRAYPTLIPRVDGDGNEIPGIRSPDVAAPLGTYTGWNMRGANFAEGALMVVGSYFPFAKTRTAREAGGDPRLSLEERYANDSAYVEAVRIAATSLQSARLLLEEDVDRYVEKAQAFSITE